MVNVNLTDINSMLIKMMGCEIIFGIYDKHQPKKDRFSAKIKDCIDQINVYVELKDDIPKIYKATLADNICTMAKDISVSLNYNFGCGVCYGINIPQLPKSINKIQIIEFFNEVKNYFKKLGVDMIPGRIKED